MYIFESFEIILIIFLRIRGFAYSPFALSAFGCGFADLLIRRLRYLHLAADSRICVFAVCVLAYPQLANLLIYKIITY